MQGYLGVKPGWTRISFPYYISNDEFEFILTALEFIAIYGQRFLPLYHFNLRTGSWTFKKKAHQDLLDNAIQGMNIGHDQSKDGNNAEKHDQFAKFSDYLETAKRIANLLPKFPPQRRLPEDIDINFLHFRV